MRRDQTRVTQNLPNGAQGVELGPRRKSLSLFAMLLQARRWHGQNWWLILGGISYGVFISLVAIFPGFFAPYSPSAEVGPRFLPPNAMGPSHLVYGRAASDLPDGSMVVGVLAGESGGESARTQVETLNRLLGSTSARVRLARFQDERLLVDALLLGEVFAVVIDDSSEVTIELLAGAAEVQNVGELESAFAGRRYILGTDSLGRDSLSRIVWGTRVALYLGLAAPLVAITGGVPIGLISAWIGGKVDKIFSIFMDSIIAFPGLLSAIIIAAVIGPGYATVIVALTVLYVPTFFRVVRSRALVVKNELYVEAARSSGFRASRILTSFVTPNSIQSVIVLFSASVGNAILISAALSFIGLGLPPGTIDWGSDLARAQGTMQTAWWLALFPGMALSATVFAFSMVGDALNEIFSPRLTGRK